MGRAKLNLKKIEHNATRHVTFAKRKSGLRKKTNQLSILCDADVAVMLFSSTGRLSCFSGDKIFDDVLIRYLNLPERIRGPIKNREVLLQQILQVKREREIANQITRRYEPDPEMITSFEDAELCEQFIMEAMQRIEQLKDNMENEEDSPNNFNNLEIGLEDTYEILPELDFDFDFNFDVDHQDFNYDSLIGSNSNNSLTEVDHAAVVGARDDNENILLSPWNGEFTWRELQPIISPPAFHLVEEIVNYEMEMASVFTEDDVAEEAH
ncbi:MADS-box protein defh21 [Acorus calamus]|uniref:MADS-box protein defh21 n=1 Tax=Acorus calamus TaxID=4465 RepID=A0AAV9CPX3_ACOCL|nr:MADS-box protein defh21 [Acorus calamus]